MSVSVVTSIMTSMAKSPIMNVTRHAPEIPVKSVEVLGNSLSMMQVKLCISQTQFSSYPSLIVQVFALLFHIGWIEFQNPKSMSEINARVGFTMLELHFD